jgi:hypothetical protein
MVPTLQVVEGEGSALQFGEAVHDEADFVHEFPFLHSVGRVRGTSRPHSGLQGLGFAHSEVGALIVGPVANDPQKPWAKARWVSMVIDPFERGNECLLDDVIRIVMVPVELRPRDAVRYAEVPAYQLVERCRVPDANPLDQDRIGLRYRIS